MENITKVKEDIISNLLNLYGIVKDIDYKLLNTYEYTPNGYVKYFIQVQTLDEATNICDCIVELMYRYTITFERDENGFKIEIIDTWSDMY